MKIKPIFTTHTTTEVPAGPQGQPAHPAGSAVSIASNLVTNRFGDFIVVTPNPIFFFFNFTEKVIEDLSELTRLINHEQKFVIFPGENVKHRNLNDGLIFEFMERAILVPILLMTAIEAYSNQAIPENFVYKGKSKIQIERYLTTEEKIEKVFYLLYKKDISAEKIWSDFKSLKVLRDKLIHLKTNGKHYIRAYNDLFIECIDVNFEEYFESCKSIIEYFDQDFFKDT